MEPEDGLVTDATTTFAAVVLAEIDRLVDEKVALQEEIERLRVATDTTDDRNDKLRALWVLIRRAGGQLHIAADEVAAAPLALGVTSVRQPDGRISLWADDAGETDATTVACAQNVPAPVPTGSRADKLSR
jgi:hypothetical protein